MNLLPGFSFSSFRKIKSKMGMAIKTAETFVKMPRAKSKEAVKNNLFEGFSLYFCSENKEKNKNESIRVSPTIRNEEQLTIGERARTNIKIVENSFGKTVFENR